MNNKLWRISVTVSHALQELLSRERASHDAKNENLRMIIAPIRTIDEGIEKHVVRIDIHIFNDRYVPWVLTRNVCTL